MSHDTNDTPGENLLVAWLWWLMTVQFCHTILHFEAFIIYSAYYATRGRRELKVIVHEISERVSEDVEQRREVRCDIWWWLTCFYVVYWFNVPAVPAMVWATLWSKYGEHWVNVILREFHVRRGTATHIHQRKRNSAKALGHKAKKRMLAVAQSEAPTEALCE